MRVKYSLVITDVVITLTDHDKIQLQYTVPYGSGSPSQACAMLFEEFFKDTGQVFGVIKPETRIVEGKTKVIHTGSCKAEFESDFHISIENLGKLMYAACNVAGMERIIPHSKQSKVILLDALLDHEDCYHFIANFLIEFAKRLFTPNEFGCEAIFVIRKLEQLEEYRVAHNIHFCSSTQLAVITSRYLMIGMDPVMNDYLLRKNEEDLGRIYEMMDLDGSDVQKIIDWLEHVDAIDDKMGNHINADWIQFKLEKE